MIAAGPASTDALSAPKSHPDPMIDPTLAKSRPVTPTCRRRWCSPPDPSADLASLALPNDGQLEGSWASGPLRLHNRLDDRGMFVELWQSGARTKLIASFQLARGAKQGPIGFRHRFVGGQDGEISMALDGSALALDLPAIKGWPAGRTVFRRL